MDRAILFPSTFILVATLLTGIVLLSFRQTRTFAIMLLGSLLVLGVLGVSAWRASSGTHPNRMVQFDFPQPAVQISHTNDGNSTESVSAPNVQIDNQIVGQSAIVLPEDSQTFPASPVAAVSSGPAWYKLGFLAMIGLMLLGGLAFTIAMISIPKTRTFGIVLLVAGSILFVLLGAGLYLKTSYTDFGGIPSIVKLSTNNALPRQPAIPLPPGYIPQEPMGKISQSQPDNTPSPNSKQIVQAYESAIQYYCKAIAQPLKLEKTEKLTEKVSTLNINFQDIGHVSISGSSFLINSIGQALAKAMTERMKEGNPQIDITPENSTKVAQEASSPPNTVPEQPGPAKASLKNGPLAEESPVKNGFAETAEPPITGSVKSAALGTEKSTAKNAFSETAKAPIATSVESAAANKTDSAETAKMPSAPKRPDWVDKPPFVWRAGKGSEFPDYYRVVHVKPVDGDAYVMSVSTGPYSTLQECEAKIPEVLQSAVNQFVERYLGSQWMGYVQLSPDQLSQLVVAEYEETKDFSIAKMTQLHFLMNFDQKAKELIGEALNLRLFNNRAAVAGTGFFGLWLLMAVIWGYLKLDLSTKGAYRKRLRAAAGFAILIIVTTGFLVLRSLA